jgi:transcriptional regulator with XRE-family HTH domain
MSRDRTLSRAFGSAVRELRKEHGWTQAQVSEKAGIDRAHTSLLERGEREPLLGTFLAFAPALRLTPQQLLDRVLTKLQEYTTGS